MKIIEVLFMNTSNLLNDKLFCVLLPGGQVLKTARRIQKRISEHYNIYEKGSYPQIHITINRIKKKSVSYVLDSMDKLVRENDSPIELIIDKFRCYHSDKNNFLVLTLKKTPSLHDFSCRLHSKLSVRGLSTIENFDKWEYHITLINNDFAKNPLTYNQFNELCFRLDEVNNSYISYADKLELWRPILNSSEKCIRTFKLDKN